MRSDTGSQSFGRWLSHWGFLWWIWVGSGRRLVIKMCCTVKCLSGCKHEWLPTRVRTHYLLHYNRYVAKCVPGHLSKWFEWSDHNASWWLFTLVFSAVRLWSDRLRRILKPSVNSVCVGSDMSLVIKICYTVKCSSGLLHVWLPPP